jgi:hypothetical protein
MANAMVEKFRSEIELAKRPHVAYDTRIVCTGSLVITVLPNLHEEKATSYKLEILKDIEVEKEFPFAVLFVTSLCGVMAVRNIGGTVKKFFFNGEAFDRDYNGFHLRGLWQDGVRVLTAEPIPTKPKQ